MSVSGIYQITNHISERCYIGSAVNLTRRWGIHISGLRRGQHANVHLQRAFDKYGESAFGFSILEAVEDLSQLIAREQHYLDTLHPDYNIAPTAGSQLGYQFSLEARRKMSEAQKGKRHSEQTKRKISEAHKGKSLSEKTRRKISKAQRGARGNNWGKHHSEETKQKISEALKGRHHTKEARMKMSTAKRGKPHPHRGVPRSEETRQKLRAAWMPERRQAQGDRIRLACKGKPLSKEHRRKLSVAHKGKPHSHCGHCLSEETKRKISEARKAYWRRVRAARLDSQPM